LNMYFPEVSPADLRLVPCVQQGRVISPDTRLDGAAAQTTNKDGLNGQVW
jgi:hypothetical protein